MVNSLRQLGYAVYEAGEASSALEIIERDSSIDLLFTDLGLPGPLDGKALADRACSIRGALKVLITTAYAGSALIHEGRLDAGVELLSKPFTFSALASRIRELLDRPADRREHARILVVDDEALLRLLIVDALKEAGLQAEEAGNFQEASGKVRSGAGNLAAAIIDLGLPDRPGDELVPDIRALCPNIPIILATGYAHEDVRRRFSQDCFLQIIAKPFDPAVLLAMLSAFGLRSPDMNSK